MNIAAELLKTYALADEPKLLLAAVAEAREALREMNSRSQLARKLDRLLIQYKESPMAFSRRGKLVICDSDYAMETLDGQRVSGFIEAAREEIEHDERKLLASR